MRRDHELHGRRRGRNWGVLLALVALIVLLFAVTIVKLGPQAVNPTTGATWGESLADWLRGPQPAGSGAGQAPAAGETRP